MTPGRTRTAPGGDPGPLAASVPRPAHGTGKEKS
jgi:hypothetical protein